MTSSAPTPVPPPQTAVVERALCLSSLVVRGFLESAVLLANGPDEVVLFQDVARRLSTWLNEQDFTAQFTLRELEALSTVPGEWSPAQHEQQCEHVEQLGVLLWALSFQEQFPDYDEPFPLPDLQPLIGWRSDALGTPTPEKLASFPYNGSDLMGGLVQLRSQPVLATQRAAAECWQWRARVATLQRSQSTPPAGVDYAVMIGIAAEEAHAAGAIPRPIGHDFPLGTKPFSRASETDQLKCGKIADARRLALDWLCGFATPWDEVVVADAAAFKSTAGSAM